MGTHSPIFREQLRERLLQPDVISGSEMLLRSLLLEDVECVFGYPGGSVLYIYDAIYDFGGFRHLLARHEQGAIHAADGYARATGRTGVCIATSGPGATNLITGIAMAFKDNIPMVILTGNVPFSSRGTDAFQEADVIGMTISITKHNYYITDVDDIPAAVQAAFQIANTGRKGPVLIDIPKDISSYKKPFSYHKQGPMTPYVQPKISEEQLKGLLLEISRASKPLILCGEGVDHESAHRELLDFAEKANIPVALTPNTAGAFPEDHPLALGISGKQGNPLAFRALQGCDLLIVVGSMIDYRIKAELGLLSPGARIAHIDYDNYSEPDRLVHAGCYGDPAKILSAASRLVVPVSAHGIGRISSVPNPEPVRNHTDGAWKPAGFTVTEVIRLIAESAPRDVIVTSDEKQLNSKIVDFFRFSIPRSFLSPIGMEAPGFSLPAAIGAQVAYPERTVISINGESGFQKCTQELAVCAIHSIPLKIVVISNRDRSKNTSPDFVKLAEAYGLKGYRAERFEEGKDVWAKVMNSKGPVLVELVVE